MGRNLIPILAKKYKIYSTFRNNKILFKNKNVINLKIDFKKKFILPKNIFTLIHLASCSPPKFTPKLSLKNNTLIDKNIFYQSKINNIKKIIYFSSISVYKKNQININENSKLNKQDDYGYSKILGEKYLKNNFDNNTTRIIIRLSSVLGKESRNNFISQLSKKIIQNQNIYIPKNNPKYNSCIHIKDLIFFTKKLLNFKKKGLFTINLCSKNPTQISKLNKLMISELKSKSKILQSKKALVPKYSNYLAKKNFGFKPKTVLDTIKLFCKDLKS